jgi:O-antigen ligase
MSDLRAARADETLWTMAPSPRLPIARLNRAVFCVGTAAVTASQLRVVGPFGVGEFLLLGWSLTAIFSSKWRIRPSAGTWPTRVLILYVILALIGTPIGLAAGINDIGNAIRFLSALVLAALVMLALTYHADRDAYIRSWAKWFPRLVMIPTFGAYLISRTTPTFLGITVLEGSYGSYYRFQGFTTNANQLAMTSACALFLSLDLARRNRYRPWMVVMCVISLMMGYFSASDGFRVSLLAAGFSYGAITLVNKRRTVWGALRLVVVWVGLVFLLASLGKIVQSASNLSTSQGNQGGQREQLWGQCLSVFLRYPLTGVGPTTPAFGGGMKLECHNSYLDIATGGGALALLSMVALLGWIVLRHWRNGDAVRLAMVSWLLAFMVFGYQGRHPIFWMILTWLCLPESALANRSPSPMHERTRLALSKT